MPPVVWSQHVARYRSRIAGCPVRRFAGSRQCEVLSQPSFQEPRLLGCWAASGEAVRAGPMRVGEADLGGKGVCGGCPRSHGCGAYPGSGSIIRRAEGTPRLWEASRIRSSRRQSLPGCAASRLTTKGSPASSGSTPKWYGRSWPSAHDATRWGRSVRRRAVSTTEFRGGSREHPHRPGAAPRCVPRGSFDHVGRNHP